MEQTCLPTHEVYCEDYMDMGKGLAPGRVTCTVDERWGLAPETVGSGGTGLWLPVAVAQGQAGPASLGVSEGQASINRDQDIT